MAYPAGYWAELVRSPPGPLMESATGTRIWLRTSDGLPLEQEYFRDGTWQATAADTDEPDFVFGSSTDVTGWRARKAGEAWIPSTNGFRFNDHNFLAAVPWAGASSYRFFEVPATAAPNWADDTGDPISAQVGTAISDVVVPAATGNPDPTYAVVGSLPAGVTFTPASRTLSFTTASIEAGSGTITIRATNSQGSDDWTVAYNFFNPLALTDWAQPARTTVELRALCQAGAAAEFFYAAANSGQPVSGSVLGGSLAVRGTTLSSISKHSGALRLRDVPNPVDLGGLFGVGGALAESTIYLQTLDGVQSFPVAGNLGAGGGNFQNFDPPAAFRTLLNGISDGDRFILAITTPVTFAVEITGAANVLETQGTIALGTTLTGDHSGIPSYAWEVLAGSGRVVGVGTGAIYALPNVAEDEATRIRVTVTAENDDGEAITARAEASFTVQAVKNPPRVVIDTPAQVINAGAVLQLQATVTDPGGRVVSHQWTATIVGDAVPRGNFSASRDEDPTWSSPKPAVETVYALTLTATDDDGQSASRTVLITVLPPPSLDDFGAVAGFSEPDARKFKRGDLDDFGVVAGLTEPTPNARLLGQLDAFGAVAGLTEATALNEPPASPFNLHAFTRLLESILLRWSVAITGGPVDAYEVEVRPDVWIDTGSTAPEYLIENLEPGTEYRFRVRARNNGGISAPSRYLLVSTLSTLVPTVPRAPAAEETGGRSADLSWVAPVDIGGSEIIRYEFSVIDEDGQAGPFEPTDGTEPRWRVRGLALWHEYGFRIRAVNANGPGPATQTFRHYVTPAAARTIPRGVRLPLLDVDRQSAIYRLADRDCRITVWWQPSDRSWWGSLEVPANTPAVSSRRLAVNTGLLDRIADVLPGNIVLRELGEGGAEPGRDAWARPTHALVWEPE